MRILEESDDRFTTAASRRKISRDTCGGRRQLRGGNCVVLSTHFGLEVVGLKLPTGTLWRVPRQTRTRLLFRFYNVTGTCVYDVTIKAGLQSKSSRR